MRKIVLMVLLMPFVFAAQSCINKAKNYNKETEVDQEGIYFIKNGLEAGMTEVKLSTLAVSKSTNPRVTGFAKMMISDHTQAGAELNKLRTKELVDKPDAISAPHQKVIDSLANLSGAAFDKAYMQVMVIDHYKAIKLFTDAGQDRSDAVQTFAKKTLPTLQMHLDSAKAVSESLH